MTISKAPAADETLARLRKLQKKAQSVPSWGNWIDVQHLLEELLVILIEERT